MSFLNKIIRKLGKDGYTVDKQLTGMDTFIILKAKMASLMRGFYYKLFIKKSNGLLFVGRNCRISHCSKIRMGKTITIGDNVEINALSRQGITMGNNVSIHRNTIIECTGVIRELGEGLVIGNNVGIAQNCFIQVRGKVTLGNNIMFGPNVSIFSAVQNFGALNCSVQFRGARTSNPAPHLAFPEKPRRKILDRKRNSPSISCGNRGCWGQSVAMVPAR